MSENVESQTIHLLREMREENREFRREMDSFRAEMREFQSDTTTSLHALTHMVRMLYASHHDHEERIQALEGVEPAT
ncbi:hypothetical protein JQC91_15815 [Jannaschia sp. Os4]|uniref:hypothetical protein n=1 Tax=Jannaschia sp. Os4 TaxID=2807617 RepID=UPI00193A5167|nr:hypothetical protein [Jannaschia sp. Os4]MBM2577774.1 hypothetical protein [Jannaschia sp. Os4]